ncbi:MAG: M14 family metallopeptidase [Betaproteobacteria bacterium]
MNPVPHFAGTYADARDKFLAAAKARGMAISRHIHPVARGASGEVLSIDVASLGDASAPAMLLLLSATHGVEGFCGSGCQVALLNDAEFLEAAEASGVNVVFLHALNPYGFSHLRRTNEDNVDLNRNFRDFAAPPAANAAYAEVHEWLVPAAWPASPEVVEKIADYVKRHGERALQQAITGGQCEFPNGLFYGGIRPAWSNSVLRSVTREWGAGRKRMGWIDFHTGLGPRGHGEMIFSGREVSADLARTRAWWGESVTSFHDGTSASATLTGVNYNVVYDECPGVTYAGIALEYGTVPLVAMLDALRSDQWLTNHPGASASLHATIKAQVRDAFYGDDDTWKTTVYTQARSAALNAVQHLATLQS